MRKIILAAPILLAACSSTGTTPAPITQATVQADMAKAQWFLQAAGCIGSQAAAAAAPTVKAVSDDKGNAILTAVGTGGAILCNITVPAAAVAVSAPATSPAS